MPRVILICGSLCKLGAARRGAGRLTLCGGWQSAVTVDYPERAPDQLTRAELLSVSRGTPPARTHSASHVITSSRPHLRAPRPVSAHNRMLNSPPVLTPTVLTPRAPSTASTGAPSPLPSFGRLPDGGTRGEGFPHRDDDLRTSAPPSRPNGSIFTPRDRQTRLGTDRLASGQTDNSWGGAEIEAGRETARSGAATARESRAQTAPSPSASAPGWTTARDSRASGYEDNPAPRHARSGVAATRRLWVPGAKPDGPPQRPSGAHKSRPSGAEQSGKPQTQGSARLDCPQ